MWICKALNINTDDVAYTKMWSQLLSELVKFYQTWAGSSVLHVTSLVVADLLNNDNFQHSTERLANQQQRPEPAHNALYPQGSAAFKSSTLSERDLCVQKVYTSWVFWHK